MTREVSRARPTAGDIVRDASARRDPRRCPQGARPRVPVPRRPLEYGACGVRGQCVPVDDARAGLRRGVRSAFRTFAAVAALCSVAALTSAAPADAGDAAPPPVLDSPIAPFRAERLFDPPTHPWAAGHRGVDLVATTGGVVTAPGDGIVTFAGTVVNRGVVTIDHGGGWRSSLEPVEPSVAVGDRVRAGDPVGTVADGAWHCPSACLHWGVRLGGDYVNPLDVLLGYGRVRLLPLVPDAWR